MAALATKRQEEDSKPKVQSLLFKALEADGSNYLEWSIDLRTYLAAEELQGAIKLQAEEITAASQNKALFKLHRHIDYSLWKQYLMITTPHELWKELKSRFLHEKTIHLPQARNDWIQLRVLDFPDFLSFNAELHQIVSLMRLCGHTIEESELIDKTLSTFLPAATLLAQQYRNMQFQTHAKLMSYLLSAEKQQQILLKNTEQRPSAKETHTTELAARRPKGFKEKQSRNNPKQQSSSKLKDRTSPSGSNPQRKANGGETRSCHKCGRKGYLARDCRTDDFFVHMYKELQRLKSKQPESHALDTPTLDDTENYMVRLSDLGESPEIDVMGTALRLSDLGESPQIDVMGTALRLSDLGESPEIDVMGTALRLSDLGESLEIDVMGTTLRLSDLGESPEIDVMGTALRVSMHTGGIHREMALLDSATTHTILRDPLSFSFTGNNTEAWQVCKMLTIAGRRDFKFREGRAKIVLPGGATLWIERAMYAPSAHQSLISFKDLRAHGVHTFTVVKGHSEALELRQGTTVIATAYAGISGLYELPIVSTSHPQFKGALASDLSESQTETSQKLASPGSVPAKIGLWHNRRGHPGTTMFRRMIPILSGHEVCQGDANKVGVCSACAQGKMINRPSRWKLSTELSPQLHRLHGRNVIKDDFGGKLPSGRPRTRFYPRTGFYRPPTR
jgi:hypothetical protein